MPLPHFYMERTCSSGKVTQCLRRVIDDFGRDAGYEELTTNQIDAITTFLHGKTCSSFVKMVTGSGLGTRLTRAYSRSQPTSGRHFDKGTEDGLGAICIFPGGIRGFADTNQIAEK